MRPAYSLITAPTSEPVTLAQASEHLRVDSADDSTLIESLVSVAREYVDSVTGRVSLSSVWRCVAASWADLLENTTDTAKLYRTPLVSIASVSYYARGATALTVMNAANYRAVQGYEPGLVQFLTALPELDLRPDAIQIVFTAGYATAAESPQILRHAIKLIVGHFYENRMPVVIGTITAELPFGLKNLIENQKIAGWFA